MRLFLLFVLMAVLSLAPAAAAERSLLSPLAAGATLSTTPTASAGLRDLQLQAAAQGRVKVIVGLRVPFAPEGTLSASERLAQRQEISAAALTVRSRFAGAIKSRPAAVRSYSSLPFIALEVTPQELATLAADPGVISIDQNLKFRPNLAESAALVRAPEAWAAGYGGAGQTIAIVDTGIDKDHPFLAGKVVSEACFSTGGFCPGGTTTSTAPDSGRPCPLTEDCAHGTHVAGIAAGNGPSASGIARDANLMSMMVFSPDPDDPGHAAAYASDILAALNRVLELRGSFAIPAVNISIGGGRFTRTCDSAGRSLAAAVANLRSAGIATVIASGNEGYRNAMSFPACLSKAVSVGAVSDSDWGPCGDGRPTATDTVTCYSNGASFLSLLAPGSKITSSVPGGGYDSWDGTSMAAPHVAGAWAVMRQKHPNAPVSEVLAAFQASGKPVADTRVATRRPIVKARIDVAAALDRLAKLDVAKTGAGVGSVTIGTPRGTTTCSADCSQFIVTGTKVKLTARAARGSRFTGWTGVGCGTRRTCSVPLSAALTVTANFDVLRKK